MSEQKAGFFSRQIAICQVPLIRPATGGARHPFVFIPVARERDWWLNEFMPNFACLLCLALASAWPMFRGGPELQGVAGGGLPDALELRWTFQAGKAVKSSAAIADGCVFVGCDDGSVRALAADSGKQLWIFKTGDSIESSPLVLDGVVYVGSNDETLYALDAEKGTLKWSYKTEGKITGSPNWFRGPGTKVPRIIVGSHDFKVHCVDAATGTSAWTFETSNYVNGTPAVADGKIVFGGCDGILHTIDADTGKELAAVEAGAYIPGSPAVVDEQAYVAHYGGEILCIDLKSYRVVWRSKHPNAQFFSSPAVTGRFVIIGGRDKRIHCLDRAAGNVCWTSATEGDVESSPAICGDKVVFGSQDGKLRMIRLDTGKPVWSYEIGKDLTASPAVADGLVVIGSGDGNVYAFGAKKES